MESLFERSKMESRYAEPTKHKAQEFVEKFPKCASAADPEFFRTKAVQAKEWLPICHLLHLCILRGAPDWRFKDGGLFINMLFVM